MIWPESEDDSKNVILARDSPVPKAGIARMRIVMDEKRAFHKNHISVGLK